MLDRRRQILDDRVEQPRGPEVARGATTHDRKDAAVVGALLERFDDLLVGDLLALQIALHERVRDFADLVHQLLAVFARALDLGLGDLRLAPAAGGRGPARAGESWRKAFMSTRSITPCRSVFDAQRDLRRDDMGAEGALELLERAKEVRALAVEHVHEQHPGDVELGRDPPQAASW